MKNTVFSTGADKPPRKQASFSFLGIALRSALKISAVHSPISTRATKQTTKVPAGLT